MNGATARRNRVVVLMLIGLVTVPSAAARAQDEDKLIEEIQQQKRAALARVFEEAIGQAFALEEGQAVAVEPPAVEAAIGVAIDVAFDEPQARANDPFGAPLRRLLTAEIHFLRKIIALDEDQLALVRETGRAQVAALAAEFAAAQNQGQASNLPDPRERITGAIAKVLDEVVPGDRAARYRTEVAARFAARKQAALAMMMTIIDRKVGLTAKQHDEISAAISSSWQEPWSRQMYQYLYEDYAPLPDSSLLDSFFDEHQKRVWASRVNTGKMSFGWEHDAGIQVPWGGGDDLEELEQYPTEVSE